MFSRQKDTVPQGGTPLQCPRKPVSWLQGGTPKLSINRTERGSGTEWGTYKRARRLMGRDRLPYSCNREMEGQELLLGLAKNKRLWEALEGTAVHRLLPPPPPPPWPPASGAPDIMRNSTTGMMYIHCRQDRWTKRQAERKGAK